MRKFCLADKTVNSFVIAVYMPMMCWRNGVLVNWKNDDLFSDAENIKIAYIIDVQIIVRDMKCVGDILGTEFCWPKEKKIKYKIAFYPISEVMFPKDMKDKCNPRKRSIIGV